MIRLFFKLPGLLSGLIFFYLGWSVWAGFGATALAIDIEPADLKWSRLSYRAKSIFGKVVTDVHGQTIPVENAAQMLMNDPAGQAIQPSGSTVLALTVNTTIDPLFGADEILKTRSWIDPHGAAALQRIRLRHGSDFWRKSYRFTRKGVYRLRQKPQNAREKKLDVDQWTKVRNHFYAYGEKAKNCQQILEPASILSIVSAMKLTVARKPLDLVVFNKKQLHRVTATVGGRIRTKVNYHQLLEPGRPRRDADIEAIKISFQTSSMATENETPEQFSFLGLKGNFDILVDPESGLPVQVNGKAAAFGEITLRLQAVEFAQNVR